MTILTETIVPDVTSGHVADHLELHDWVNGRGNVVNITDADYGAVDGGSAATNTTAINDAVADIVATGKLGAVVIPPGMDFPVTPNGINGGSNVVFCGGGTLSTTQTTTGRFISFPAGSTKAAVVGLTFKSPNDAMIAVYAPSTPGNITKDLDIRDNVCTEAILFLGADEAVDYVDIDTNETTGNVTRNVRITGNRGLRSGTIASNRAFILLQFIIGFNVHDNICRGYAHGIQWWGGNADPAVDGALSNERKCGEGTITGNNCSFHLGDAAFPGSGGGIWGSMGRKITVGNNVLHHIGDSGFDAEGCTDIVFECNTVWEVGQGALATFSLNRNITFKGNNVEVAAAGQPAAWVHNASLNTDNNAITFDGNTFWCAAGLVAIQVEPCDTFTFINNTLRNVRVLGRFVNHRVYTVANNTLTFDVAAGAAFDAIDAGHTNGAVGADGKCIITKNTITTTVTQPAGSRAINVEQDDFNSNPLTRIEGNTIAGFTGTVIRYRWASSNSGIKGLAFIRGNDLGEDSAVIERVEAGTNGSLGRVYMDGNFRHNSGAPYPATGDIGGGNRWDVGQLFPYWPPTAGGFVGKVCTTAGAPGTTKDYGAISA